MPQGKGQRAAGKANLQDGELSFEDLDRVVGGGNTEGNGDQQHEGPAHEGGYVPPTVHAPDHLPDPINQVEQHVADHSVTGDQAVSQIADIIGHQPDHSMQNIAGAEIASLIGRGVIDANTAMTDLHNAVTQTHSLTGDQAAGILAGMMVAQYNTLGEDTSISTAAAGEVNNLIDAGLLTADHALTAFAGQVDANGGAAPILSEISSLIQHYSMTPSHVAADIGATVDNGDLTGSQAITVLASLATTFPGADHPFVAAAGQEIATLITSHNLDPADALSAVNSAGYWPYGLSSGQLPGVLLAAVQTEPDLADAAGAALAAGLAANPSTSAGNYESVVASLGVSADEAMAVLVSAAHNGQSWWASEATIGLYINHVFDMNQMMTAIQDDASTPAHADDAVTLMLSLATNGYASAFAPAVETALVSMIQNHQITATAAANDLVHLGTSSEYRRMEMLMAVGSSGAPDAMSAVADAVSALAQSQGASTVVQTMASLVGSSSSVADNPAIDAAVFQQIDALVASGALTADAAIDAVAYMATTTFRWTGKEALCNEIVTLAANANPPVGATQVVLDVIAQVQSGAESSTMLLLGYLAGHGHDLQVAAGAALAAMVDPNNYWVSNPSWVAYDVTWWVGNGSTLSAESAIALLGAAVGNGATAIPPDVAGVAIAAIITNGHGTPAQITDAIHAAVVSGVLGGDAALIMLANVAANASAAQIAVNSEMLALVTGSPPLVQPGHAADIISDLRDAAQAAGNTAFVAILNSELSVLASSDPATAVFNGLNTTTNNTDLEGAAAQLAAAMASGASSVTTVMGDIDQALANGALTVLQASSLLVDIACHGNFAAQTAAGAEFAKITNTAGTGIYDYSGQIMTSQAILSCIGIGLGGSPNGMMQTVSTPMTPEGALAFVLGALGASTTTEATRTSFEQALQTLVSGNWYGVPVLFPAPSYGVPGMASSYASAINDIVAVHAMPGPELIRAIFVADVSGVNASQELQTLIGNHSVSMTDVHTAITSGWWQVDDAVKVLAGVSATPAVMTELLSLISGGTVTPDHFIADIHTAFTWPSYLGGTGPVTVADYVRVMEALVLSSDPATHTAVVNELANVINGGLLDMTSVQAIISAAGSDQPALVDQILVALGGSDLGQLVSANLVTLDHALNVLLTNGELYGAVAHAVSAGTYDATLLANGLVQLVTSGALSASDANGIAMQMAFTADGTLATMAGTLLAALVHNGGMTASAVMSELTSNANRYANTQYGGPGINVPQMTNLLTSFIAHCDPSASAAVAQEAMTLASYAFFPSVTSALPFMVAAAGNADAAGLNTIGAQFFGMISRGDASIATLANAIGPLPGAVEMSLYTAIAKYATMNGATQTIADALGQIEGLVPAQVSPLAAVTALNNLVAAGQTFSSGANYAALVHAASAEINALAAAYPDAGALSSIDDAIRTGTMTAPQAAQMLVGMINGSAISAGVSAEINTLIHENLVSAQQIADAVVSYGTAQSQSVDTVIVTLASLAGIDPSLGKEAGNQIEYMIQLGRIPADQAMADINPLINNSLTVDQAVGLFASICSSYSVYVDGINGPVANSLVALLDGNTISAQQLLQGMAHAVANGAATADQAAELYAMVAKTHPERSDLAVQGIIALVTANAMDARSALGDVSLTFANTTDHGINFMLNIVGDANAPTAFQSAFGASIAGLVIPDSAPPISGYLYASAAVALVHNAYQQGIATPHAAGTLTAQQELTLLAGMLAAASGSGPAGGLLAPIHTELVALINSHAVTDTAVVTALEAVGANSALIQSVVNTEIANLETALGPQMMIDVAAQTGADMAQLGRDLANLIYNYGQGSSVRIGDIMADITAANAAGNLSGTQALDIISSLLGNATAGAYAIIKSNPADADWLASVAGTLEHLAQRGLPADAIGAAIEGIAGIGPALMFPSDAAALLASIAAYPDLQGTAASHIASLVESNSGGAIDNSSLGGIVAGIVSTVPGHLQAADAVRLLALVAAAGGTATSYGQIAEGLGGAQVSALLTPDLVASTVEGMVQAGTLTAQQALHFLTPYGDIAPGAAGHAIGDLIANNQVSISDFTALVYGGVQQDSQAIQNTNYWQQVAGTGSIAFTDAILVLAAMTSRTPFAIAELAAIASADTSSVWFNIENALVNAGQNPATSGLTPQEAVRALTTLVVDSAAATAHGGGSSFTTQLASDIGNLVGTTMSLGDALAQVMSVGVSGSQSLSDGAAAIVGMLIGTGPANGPDAIISAIGHGITADQAITVLTELSTSPSVNLQSHVRADIDYLITSGQLQGAQAMSDIHNACVASGIGAGQELSLLAGIFATGYGYNAVETAVAQQIDALIASGRLTLGQVMDGIAQGTFLTNAVFPTQEQVQASYLAGGLSSTSAAALIAMVAAGSADPAAPSAAANEIAAMIAGNRMDPALAMSGIDGAVAAGVLDAAKAVVVLASMPLNASDALHTAAGGEIAALVSDNRITLDDAVAALVAMSHQGQTAQQMQAGAALGLLVAQHALDIATAIADVHAAVQNHTLTADQAVALLAGINAAAAPGVSTAVGNELVALIGQGEPVANVLSSLLTAAESGSAAIQAGAGAIIGMLVAQNLLSAAQAIQSIDTAFTGGALPAVAATNLLLNIAGTGDVLAQAAAGQEIGHIVQAAGSIGGLGTQLAASNLSQDQAVVVLAAAIANATTSASQTQVAALIQNMVTSGPIGVAQVMSDIDGAVGHGLTATQALTALAHLEEAGVGAMRTAILTETAALVTNHNVPVADATSALLAAAHGGSSALQSLVGGMLASLADHGLLTNQQVSDAISSAAALTTYESLGVLIGMGVNGNAAAQAASGNAILMLVLNGFDLQTVISTIHDDAAQNQISPEHALQVVLNIMGAAIADLDANPTSGHGAYDNYIRDHMSSEVVSLTTSVAFHGAGAQATLINAASGSVALAEAVGLCLAAMWSADQTTPNPVVRNGTPLLPILTDALANHQMTPDEALMLALASSAGGQAQTLLTGLVQAGAVNVGDAVHFLAVTAARTGDSDPTNPYLAYSGFAGPDTVLMTAAIGDLQALITGVPGVPSLATAATVVNDIAAAAVAHDLTGMQAASLLANLAGRLGASDAVAAAGAIGSLVTQGLIDNTSALHAIGWTVGQTGVLSQSQANLMYASMAISADPAVQQIAVWAYSDVNLGSETLAHALHAITTNPAFTHDQALTIITNIASGLVANGSQDPSAVAGALAGEILSMVTSNLIAADHAVTMLVSLAVASNAQLGNLGIELSTLISANAISFAQVVSDLTHSTLSVDQVVTTLTGISAANSALDPQVLNQIIAMIDAGTLTPAHAMADIGNAAPDVALRLLTQCANASVNIEDAAAVELATLLAQASMFSPINDFYSYAKAHLDPVHAMGWIVSVAAHGNSALQTYVDNQLHNDLYGAGSLGTFNVTELLTNYLANFTPTPLVQYYIGQVLGRLIDHPVAVTPAQVVENVIVAIDQSIVGTQSHTYLATTPGITPASLPKPLTADVAALVMLGLNNTTHNTDAQAAADSDLKLVSHGVDAQFIANVVLIMPPQQALTQLVTLVQNGWADTALVAKQLADMVSHGTLTAQQVITAMAPLDTSHQLALMTDIVAHTETNNSVLTSQLATLVLLTWGVAPTSQVYASLHEALAQVVPDFVGLTRGTTTAAQAINDIKAAALAHGVSADLLLLAVYQSTTLDSGAADFASSAKGALSQIGQELYSHLTDGSAAGTVAQMVLGGAIPESAAASLMQELATSATIPPNPTMLAVMNGQMSVWYADAHYPGWSSNANEVAFTVTQAVGMMHVDVHTAQDIAAINNGTMSGAQAVADILAAGGNSEYAKDLGLMALVHGLEGSAAAAGALPAIDAELAARLTSDTTADAIVGMTAHGWLPAQSAVDMFRSEIAEATSHLEPAAASFLECLALARLDMAASGQVDPNATAQQQLIHGGASSHAIENIIEASDAAKILTGLGALQLTITDSYELGAGLALAQNVTQVLVAQLEAQEAAHPGSTGTSDSGTSDWASGLPADMQSLAHIVEVASQYFTLGMGYAHTGIDAIKSGFQSGLSALEANFAPAGEIADLSTNPANIQRWADLGVDLAVGGVPGAGIFNAAGAGLPVWASGLQSAVLNEALGAGAGGMFTGVNIGSHVAVMILGIPAIENGMHDHGMTLAAMKIVADSCSLISGLISGTVHTAVNMNLAIAMNTFDTFKDICTGNDPTAAAEQLGKSLFVYMTGGSFDSVAQVGDDVGAAMVDIFSGNPQNLAGDAEAIGLDSLKVIQSNPFVQMAGGVLSNYVDQMVDLVGLSPGDALMIGFLL